MRGHSAPIQRFIASLGKKVFCTSDFERGLRLLPRDHALRHTHVSLNQILRRYIVIDVDYEGGALAYEEVGLEPTIILTNPVNAHAHLLYELQSPVGFSEQARYGPQAFFLALQRGMTAAMGGDLSYVGLVVKNPLSHHWRMTCCDVRYSLTDLADYCDPISPYEAEVNDCNVGGRNTDLFDHVRLWAYKAVKGYGNFSDWEIEVRNTCEMHNDCFDTPLPYSEIKSTAKSIAKWTWRHRHNIGKQKNRGAAGIDPALPLIDKQVMGADYTNKQRKRQTEQKIHYAVAELRRQDKKIGATAIANVAGLSRKTVYNHRHIWKH